MRNYGYPALAGWRLRRRPRRVRLLGEDIVLFRDHDGAVFALADRCPHRGASLSQGKCLYPGAGTISCPYHGWRFSGATGRCVAKLMEGPDAPLPHHAAVKSYPVRELRGVVWVFVGDMAALPLEDDLPECLARPDAWHALSRWRTYHCNWRVLKDNLCHDRHAPPRSGDRTGPRRAVPRSGSLCAAVLTRRGGHGVRVRSPRCSASSVPVGGSVLGISNTVVTPPTAAAAGPVPQSSLCV